MTLRLFSVATVFVAVVLLATLVIPEAIAHASANEGDFSGLLGSSEASRIIDNAYQRYLAGRKHLKRSVDSFDPIPPKAHQCSAEAVAREQKDLFERESAGKDLSQVFRALEKRSETQTQGTPGPIKLSRDVTLLAAKSDVRQCSAVGDIVLRGFANSGSPLCSSSLTTGCRFNCTEADIPSSDLFNELINNVIPAAEELFASLVWLKDTPTGDTLYLDADYYAAQSICDYDIPISDSYVAGGVGIPNSHFHVYYTTRPEVQSSLYAVATYCNARVVGYTGTAPNRRFVLGRTLAGRVNLNPSGFLNFLYGGDYANGLGPMQFNLAVRVIFHELTHALGFLPVDLSGAFVNEDDIRYGSDNVIMIENQVNSLTQVEKSYKKVITPKVTALARLHYNCPDFLGLPLEDAGSDATSGYHWDMMAVGHEIMAGSILYDSEITSLTLAMLEDMGWYVPQYQNASIFAWGKNKGCDFTADCTATSWSSGGYWCTTSGQVGCSPHYKSRATCNYQIYGSSLTSFNQHFADPRAGGYNGLANYCPYYMSAAATGLCTNAAQAHLAPRAQNEYFGDDSRCWDAIMETDSARVAACYQTKCDSGLVSVNVSGVWHQCPVNGGTLSISSAVENFTITCPPAYALCRSTYELSSPPSTPIGPRVPVAVPAASVDPPGGSASSLQQNLFIMGVLLVIMCAL